MAEQSTGPYQRPGKAQPQESQQASELGESRVRKGHYDPKDFKFKASEEVKKMWAIGLFALFVGLIYFGSFHNRQ